MKPIFYIILLFLILGVSCTKKKTVAKNKTIPKDSLEIFFSLANNFDLSLDQRQQYIQKASAIVNRQNNDSVYRTNLFKIANRYYNLDRFEDYKKTVTLIIKKSGAKQDNNSIAKGSVYLGDYFLLKERSDSAFYYYNKAENKYLELNDTYNVALTILNKATLQYMESDFLGAEIAVFKVLKIIKNKNFNDIWYNSYNLLGQIYNELEDYNNAIAYHNKALSSIDDKLMNSFAQPKATSYNNIGFVYQNKKMFPEAKTYFEKGLKQKNVFKDKPALFAMLLNNLAYSKFQLKENKGLPQLFFQSLQIRDSLQITTGIIASKINISEYFLSKRDTLRALQYANEALYLSKKANNSRSILNTLKQVSLVDPKNTSKYTKEYILISEKLQKSDRAIGNKFSRIEYETEEVIEKNDYLTTKNRNLLYGLISFGVVALLLYLVLNQRNRNKVLLYKQRQQKANEDIYNLMISQQSTIDLGRVKEKKRVAQELHDGVLGRIFGLRINLDTLNQFDDSNAIEKRNEYLVELRNIEQDLREISHDLSRENKELINNFVVILHNLLEEQRKTFSTNLHASIDNAIDWDAISNSIKINIYRIVQESLQNINKYAHANSIHVKCLKNQDQLILEIIDDGIGFNTIKAKKGIGLQNIRSRALDCNGTAIINSIISKGTHITITIHLV
ncbi:tetratricopeptide repeat-containing sensor histidine kinase [Flavobacterium sp. CHNK8]|uniref:tetratricopeptide repeat-containing sensor histidine kinase n=1 Tax=Flavobacterium sp. CHNK8 TaxID=2871165 RepID=UPI0021066F2C|nr:tetratricopeptide repeat-containing sensor histidine kinase [Flavobacterium sp. CHNK8]